MSKGSGNGASAAAQTSANNQQQAYNQIYQLIQQTNPQLMSALSPLLSGNSNLNQAAPGLNSFFSSEQSGTTAPGLFYSNEMTQGGGAGFQQASTNAQNQLQQQFQQGLSSIMGNLAPGQNPGAAETALQNNELTASANLGSQLAGQQQSIMQSGANGLATLQGQGAAGIGQTASAQDQQILSALQPLLQFFGSSAGALGGIGSTSGSQAVSYSNLANQENQQANAGWSSLFSGLGGLGLDFATGGLGSLFGAGAGAAAGAGGLGDLLGGAILA